MPKLKQPPPSDAKKLWAIIHMQQELKGMRSDETAKRLHCSVETVRRDAVYPEKMSLDRFIRYCQITGTPIASVIQTVMSEVTKNMIT